MKRQGLFLAFVFLFLFPWLSGCYTARTIVLETRCGIGKDYSCGGPQFIDKVDGQYTISNCGCVDKETGRR